MSDKASRSITRSSTYDVLVTSGIFYIHCITSYKLLPFQVHFKYEIDQMTLELHFESKRNGGGEIEDMKMQSGHAILEFKDAEGNGMAI